MKEENGTRKVLRRVSNFPLRFKANLPVSKSTLRYTCLIPRFATHLKKATGAQRWWSQWCLQLLLQHVLPAHSRLLLLTGCTTAPCQRQAAQELRPVALGAISALHLQHRLREVKGWGLLLQWGEAGCWGD